MDIGLGRQNNIIQAATKNLLHCKFMGCYILMEQLKELGRNENYLVKKKKNVCTCCSIVRYRCHNLRLVAATFCRRKVCVCSCEHTPYYCSPVDPEQEV